MNIYTLTYSDDAFHMHLGFCNKTLQKFLKKNKQFVFMLPDENYTLYKQSVLNFIFQKFGFELYILLFKILL